MPGGATLAQERWSESGHYRELKDHRVTVRLAWSVYSNLEQAAALYAVKPTTLARMLINRGVCAILDERRRDDRLHGSAD